MTRLRYSANHGRTSVRLISTPTTEGTDPVSTTIEGVKFSDQLGALLDHARAHGFRIEYDTRSKRGAPGVIVYAPDKDVPPISVNERNARFNKPHYENIRRDIYRAGCPPLPGDAGRFAVDNAAVGAPPTQSVGMVLAETEEEAKKQVPEGAQLVELGSEDFARDLRDTDKQGPLIGAIITSLLNQAGHAPLESAMVADVTKTMVQWLITTGRDSIAEAAADQNARLEAHYRSQIDEALAMASEKEAEAERLRTQLDRATEKETNARNDCAVALERARVAEAKAAELEAAIAPLRNILGAAPAAGKA